MDRLQAMTVFVTVVEQGGFARAARKLNLSPPVITRAVAELEAHLGVALLIRTTRVVRVTEAGARYVEDCRRLLAEIEEADEAAGGIHATPRGPLCVTASMLFGKMYVTPIVLRFLERYPQTQVSCVFVDRVVNLMEEGIDVAVRIGELPDSSLQAIRVGSVRRVICAAPAYLAAHGIPQRPEDLAQHTLISATGVTPAPQWRLMADGASTLFDIRPRLATTTNDAAIAATLSGFGLSRLMSYQVAELIAQGRLQTVLSDYEPAVLPVHVVHREGRRASQKVRAFLDLAIEALRADPTLN